MNQRCPVCQLLFEREPGYFLGAMYISYGMATACLLVGLGVGALLLPEVDLGWIVLMSGAAFAPFCADVVMRALLRVLWIFFLIAGPGRRVAGWQRLMPLAA